MLKWGVLLAALTLPAMASAAEAHVLPWRPGETRMIGVGHCAKGACTKRASFSPSKPHCHIGPGTAPGNRCHWRAQ